MAGINTSDSEPKQINSSKSGRRNKALKIIGNVTVATALTLGVMANSPSSTETNVKQNRLNPALFLENFKPEKGERYFLISTTSISKGFGEIDGKPQGSFFYLDGKKTSRYDEDADVSQVDEKSEYFGAKVFVDADIEGMKEVVLVVINNISNEKFVPEDFTLDIEGIETPLTTRIPMKDLWYVRIVPNLSGKNSISMNDEGVVTINITHNIEGLRVFVKDKSGKSILWNINIENKNLPASLT